MASPKQIGVGNVVTLDPIGADVDIGSNMVTFAPALMRTMLDVNSIGDSVLDQIHGARDLTVSFTLHNLADSGLFDIFSVYTQDGVLGEPPFLMSFSWVGKSAAISGTNRRWIFLGGTCPTIPGPNVDFNSVKTTEFPVRVTDAGIQVTDIADYISVINGATITNVPDAPPA